MAVTGLHTQEALAHPHADAYTHEGFTMMVANNGLEKAEPIDPGPVDPGPRGRRLYIPSEGCSVNYFR